MLALAGLLTFAHYSFRLRWVSNFRSLKEFLHARLKSLQCFRAFVVFSFHADPSLFSIWETINAKDEANALICASLSTSGSRAEAYISTCSVFIPNSFILLRHSTTLLAKRFSYLAVSAVSHSLIFPSFTTSSYSLDPDAGS